jgi:hypothetical protein
MDTTKDKRNKYIPKILLHLLEGCFVGLGICVITLAPNFFETIFCFLVNGTLILVLLTLIGFVAHWGIKFAVDFIKFIKEDCCGR